MNNPQRPAPLKSTTPTTHGPGAAHPTASPDGGQAPKDAARKGVPSSSDPYSADGRHPAAWLRITVSGRGAVPTATSWCRCGRDRSAIGHRRVKALIDDHAAHRTACPLRHQPEGRNAA